MVNWKWLAGGAVGVLALLLISRCERRNADAKEATYQERLRVLAVERDSLAKVKERRDTLYQRDTVRLTKAVTKYQTLHDSVLVRLTDTVLVKETIIASDDAIKSCRATVTTCEQRVADRDAIIANERKTRATGDSLHRVQLAKANPRLAPYVEAGVDPFDVAVIQGRAGVQLRVLGPFSLTGAVAYQSIDNHRLTGVVGFRVTF